MLDGCQTVQDVVKSVDELRKAQNEVRLGLRKLTGHQSPSGLDYMSDDQVENWLQNLEKDERYSVKLLLKEYIRISEQLSHVLASSITVHLEKGGNVDGF